MPRVKDAEVNQVSSRLSIPRVPTSSTVVGYTTRREAICAVVGSCYVTDKRVNTSSNYGYDSFRRPRFIDKRR